MGCRWHWHPGRSCRCPQGQGWGQGRPGCRPGGSCRGARCAATPRSSHILREERGEGWAAQVNKEHMVWKLTRLQAQEVQSRAVNCSRSGRALMRPSTPTPSALQPHTHQHPHAHPSPPHRRAAARSAPGAGGGQCRQQGPLSSGYHLASAGCGTHRHRRCPQLRPWSDRASWGRPCRGACGFGGRWVQRELS